MYKASETFSSCLTKWVDRLLPFELTVVRTPGRTLGEADYLSRLPSKSINVVTEFANVLDEAITAKGKKPKKNCGAISQSEAKTHVLTVSQQNDSVLQNAKTNKRVKNNSNPTKKVMACELENK